MEDEDDFAMLAEDLFTDLDTEDTGKISKKEIRNALARMGVEMGIPPSGQFVFHFQNSVKLFLLNLFVLSFYTILCIYNFAFIIIYYLYNNNNFDLVITS